MEYKVLFYNSYKMNIKTVSIVLIIAIILNLALFAFGFIGEMSFWLGIIIVGFVAYKVLPKFKKKV